MAKINNKNTRSKQNNNFVSDVSLSNCKDFEEFEDYEEEEYCLVSKLKERKKITKFKSWKEQERQWQKMDIQQIDSQ